MRQFYTIYSQDQISQTLSDQFKNLPAVSTGRRFYLSWSGNTIVRFMSALPLVRLRIRITVWRWRDRKLRQRKMQSKTRMYWNFLAWRSCRNILKASWRAASSTICSSSCWSLAPALPSSAGRCDLPLMKNISWWIWFSITVCCVALLCYKKAPDFQGKDSSRNTRHKRIFPCNGSVWGQKIATDTMQAGIAGNLWWEVSLVEIYLATIPLQNRSKRGII